MPELPDIEGFRRIVEHHAVGTRISAVRVLDARWTRNCAPEQAASVLSGRRIVGARRHGKWLFVDTDSPTMVIHFGMTGALRWQAADHVLTAADRVVIATGSGSLCVRDRRNLGGMWLVRDGAPLDEITGPLGPDALATDARGFGELLARSRRGLKVTLTDQAVIAGLGNMLSDEILWRARLDPARAASGLDAAELEHLHRALRRVLTDAVRAGHIPRGPTWLSGERAASDGSCPRCHRPLDRRRIGGRSSLWCPHCQGTSAEKTTASSRSPE
jgi:formamidopyrimidine-DNA glycosylase